MKKKIYFICLTGVYIAMVFAVQALTRPLGNQLITGALVNTLLILSALTAGIVPSVMTALISPLLAVLFGITTLWQTVPFIMLGNLTLVIVVYIGSRTAKGHKAGSEYLIQAIFLVVASAAKFAVLWLGTVKVLPVIFGTGLQTAQLAKIAAMFGVLQLYTALIGSFIALLLYAPLSRALEKAGLKIK